MKFLHKHVLTICFCLVGITCIALGAARGEIETLWRKAVQICMECIGLG